jgi:hypothetical protein
MTVSNPSNPFDPKALRLKQDFAGPAGVKKLLTRVPVRKPSKQEWFRTHPDADYRMDMGVVPFDEDDAVYAVTQDLQAELVDLMVPVTIYTAITRQGTVVLWNVRLPGEDGKNHDAWTSSHEAAELATKSWTRLQWNPALGAYDMFQATGIVTEPMWPEASFDELLKIGFQGKIIDKSDHLVIKKLRGEA